MSAIAPIATGIVPRSEPSLRANRVLTRRSKSTASLPSPMLINWTQTELDATEEDHALALGRLETALCQRVKLESSGDQRGDVGDRETVASDKLVPA